MSAEGGKTASKSSPSRVGKSSSSPHPLPRRHRRPSLPDRFPLRLHRTLDPLEQVGIADPQGVSLASLLISCTSILIRHFPGLPSEGEPTSDFVSPPSNRTSSTARARLPSRPRSSSRKPSTDLPLVILSGLGRQLAGGHRAGHELLLNGDARKVSSAGFFLRHEVADGVPHGALEPLVHRPRNPLVEATEEFAHEQGRDDFVRLLLRFPVAVIAGVPDPAGDISRPVETPEAFEDLAVGGIPTRAMTFSSRC